MGGPLSSNCSFQVFAQLARAVAASTFDDPAALVEIVARLCRSCQWAPGTAAKAKGVCSAVGSVRVGHTEVCHDFALWVWQATSEVLATGEQLEEASDWAGWARALPQTFSHITGPDAGHWFKFCRRADLGAELCSPHLHQSDGELSIPIEEFADGTPPDPDDVLLVVKHWMADAKPYQVLAVAPARARTLLLLAGPSEAGSCLWCVRLTSVSSVNMFLAVPRPGSSSQRQGPHLHADPGEAGCAK